MTTETDAMKRIGDILDYLLNDRGVGKCWSMNHPCAAVDEDDRQAALIVRSCFTAALHE